MVRLGEMTHFMGNDIVENFCRGEDKSPVEGQVSSHRTTAPAALLIADGNTSGTSAKHRCLFRHDGRKRGAGVPTQPVMQTTGEIFMLSGNAQPAGLDPYATPSGWFVCYPMRNTAIRNYRATPEGNDIGQLT